MVRKVLLVAHVTTSVGLIGAVISFLVLSVAGLAGELGVYVAADLVADRVVLPLALAALVLGIVQSLASPWGLLQHYWVVIKLAATLLVVGVLFLQLPSIDALATATATELSDPDLMNGRRSLVLHSAAGMVPLLLAVLLSIFKPKGLTKYGWNKLGAGP